MTAPDAPVPVAVAWHRAGLAQWIARPAERPDVGDHREIPGLPLQRRRATFEGGPNRLVIGGSHEIPSPRDSGDVRVRRERRMTARHRQHDVGGLRADAGQRHQRGPGRLGRKLEDRFDATVPSLQDRLRDAPNPRRFLPREAGVPYRCGYFVVARGGEDFRCDLAELRSQSLQTASLVRDGGALGEDRRHEDLESGHASRPILHGIGPLQDRHRPAKGARVHGIATPRGGKSFQPLTKERTIVTMFRGRSRSRRVKYGSQFGPYGMYSATRWPCFASSSFRGSRTPWSIANSNGVGCSRASSRARPIIRPS